MSVDGVEALRTAQNHAAAAPAPGPRALRVLCLGAHSDDIEIGCAATLLGLVERGSSVRVDWVVLSALGERAVEARRSADALLGDRAD